MKNMRNITEKVLLSLGFEREDVSAEESGDEPYYYFVFNLKSERAILITNANNECLDGMYCVEIFDESDAGKIYDKVLLKKFVKVIKLLA
jgi:hypothetical protein